MEAWIEIKDLKKKIDNFQLGPLSLTCEPGTITALIGKNGAGKSTFTKLLMNLATQDDGEIIIQGETIRFFEDKWKEKIAYQPQTLIGCDPFNGKELKELTSKWYPTWDQGLFEELVRLFEIPLNKPYGKLSPGVQQKLNIALTLPRDTDILILDEPTASMDIPSKQRLMDVLSRWMERGDKVMIIASHQIEDIRKLADYLVIFDNGQITGKYEKEELTGNYKRYWMENQLPTASIPGEIERKSDRILVSENSERTEEFFQKENMKWLQAESLELEEIITLKLS